MSNVHNIYENEIAKIFDEMEDNINEIVATADSVVEPLFDAGHNPNNVLLVLTMALAKLEGAFEFCPDNTDSLISAVREAFTFTQE